MGVLETTARRRLENAMASRTTACAGTDISKTHDWICDVWSQAGAMFRVAGG
jgi:hypothetical protein